MPDTKPMTVHEVQLALDSYDGASTGAAMCREILRLLERERVLIKSLRWAIVKMPVWSLDGTGIRCYYCDERSANSHALDCSYRQAKEALGA